MDTLRVLLIEPNRFLSNGIISLLNEQADITVVPSRASAGALRLAGAFAPQVVLFSLGLEWKNTQKLLAVIRRHLPQSRIVILDLHPTRVVVLDHTDVEFCGYVRRDASLKTFLDTLRAAAVCADVMPADSHHSILSLIAADAIRNDRKASATQAIKLTDYEHHVAILAGAGKSINQIAALLNLAASAIAAHLRNTIDKLALYQQLQSSDFSTLAKSQTRITPQSKKG